MKVKSIPRHISQLLEFESSQKAVFDAKFRNTSISIWPQLRTQLWVEMSQAEFPLDVKYCRLSTREKYMELFNNLIGRKIHSKRVLKKSDVLFVVSGRTLIKEKSLHSNWLINHLSHELDSRYILHVGRPLGVEFTRSSKPDKIVYLSIYFSSILASVLRRFAPSRHFVELDNHVDDVCNYFKSLLTDESVTRIKESMHTFHFKSKIELKLWSRILKKVDPRMVVIEDASYGSMSILVQLAKAKQIIVVEPQHGWIGAAHGSYNYGKYLLQEHNYFLPDHLLTFGNYWKFGINHSAIVTPIGKPALGNTGHLRNTSDEKKVALCVSSGGDLERFVNLVIDISEKTKDLGIEVILRLHPSEVNQFYDSTELSLRKYRANLDTNFDVYETLAKATWVIATTSTILFESLVFGAKPIVLQSNLSRFYCDPSFMRIVHDSDELFQSLSKPQDAQLSAEQVNEIWADGTAFRVREFYKETLPSLSSGKVEVDKR